MTYWNKVKLSEVLCDWFVHGVTFVSLCALCLVPTFARLQFYENSCNLVRFLAKTFDIASNSVNASQNLNAT